MTGREVLSSPQALAGCHAEFRRWLGPAYDLGSLDVVLAAAAVERMDGDPLWVLVVSGSGNAKTETVMPLEGAGAVSVSSIASEGALLSATSKQEQSKDATGGLLREIGSRGVLVIKDVTTILSANRDQRAQVLAALREVYDGRWTRRVGTDGGKALAWEGRIAVVGAVTTAWDKAHTVVASMGDRFVLVRTDSRNERAATARQALVNTGSETAMRRALSRSVAAVLDAMDGTPVAATDEEAEVLVNAATLVTLARTAVEFDYRGNVEMAHAAEAATRFTKQLVQVFKGACAIGCARDYGLALAVRVARDSMPPLRLAIVDDLAAHPNSTAGDIYRRIGMPRTTVSRQVDALHALGVLEQVGARATRDASTESWTFSLARDIHPEALVPRQDTRSAI